MDALDLDHSASKIIFSICCDSTLVHGCRFWTESIKEHHICRVGLKEDVSLPIQPIAFDFNMRLTIKSVQNGRISSKIFL
jgi:hypothetical protein